MELINNATLPGQPEFDNKESKILAKQALRYIRMKAAKVSKNNKKIEKKTC